MDENEFNKLLRTESVFRTDGQKSLAQAWVPTRGQHLICRDNEIRKLIAIYRPITNSESSFSENTLILGKGGIGKTITSQYFGKLMKHDASTNGINLFVEYYDCLQHRSKSSILRNISKKLLKFSSGHGFSDNEILEQILIHLKKEKQYVLIILDEVHHIGSEDILSLLNASIGYGAENSNFSILLITREYDWFRVDNEKISSRTQHQIKFEPYSKKDAYKILDYRRRLAFREGILDDDELQLIADIVEDTKNMRNGIDVMRACGIRCDEKRLSRITPDMILDSREVISSSFRQDVVDNLKLSEKISLLSIARTLNETGDAYVMVDPSFENYQLICEEMNKKSHSKTTFRKYIRKLGDVKVVEMDYINPSSEEKGRKLQLKLLDIGPEKLCEYLEKFFGLK